MPRKETKRKKATKVVKSVCKKRRKEIIIEVVVVAVIIGLFVAGITKIIRDDMQSKHGYTHKMELTPSSFNSIVTEVIAKNPYNF